MMIDPLVIPIVAILLPMILVPVILGIRYAKFERQLEHAERIRALELGRSLPGDEGWWTLPRISVAVGAGVPAVAFFCAWQASHSLADPSAAWMAASFVGLPAVISGSVLASRHFLRDAGAGEVNIGNGRHAKPQFDADAFDVVSSRG